MADASAREGSSSESLLAVTVVRSLLVSVMCLVLLPLPGLSASGGVGGACGGVVDDGFADVVGSVHEPAVDCVVAWEVARGVSATRFGGGAVVTRAQMASFVANVVIRTGGDLPVGRDAFGDDDASVHEGNINRLAAVGVVAGRGRGFAPDVAVSRGQMATFLVRAYAYRVGAPLPAGADAFADDDGQVHESAINQAAAAGLATGDARGRFRPSAAVRRDQMAAFVARLLDLFDRVGVFTGVMCQPPFAPHDESVFPKALDLDRDTPGYETGAFVGGTPSEPGHREGQDEALVRRELEELLTRRLHGDAGRVAAVMTLVDEPWLVAKVPDIELRAATVALHGLVGGDAAVASLQQDFHRAAFVTFPDDLRNGIGLALFEQAGNGRPSAVFNDRYRHEHWLRWAPIMVHEVTAHLDRSQSGYEELFGNYAQAIVYGQLLLEQPQLAAAEASILRVNNAILLAWLNTRHQSGAPSLLADVGSVFPGGRQLARFSDTFPLDDPPSAANPWAREVMTEISGVSAEGLAFDERMLGVLDGHHAVFGDADRVRLGNALNLDLASEPGTCPA